MVCVDNVVRDFLESGFVGDRETEEEAVSLMERVGENERVEAVVVQTFRARDYDSFLMAIVRSVGRCARDYASSEEQLLILFPVLHRVNVA